MTFAGVRPPGRIWQKEILEDLRPSQSTVARFLLPALILCPLAFLNLPDGVKVSGLPMAVIFTGTFGSAVGVIKMRESGMIERLAVTPISPARIIGEHIMANALLDGLELLLPFLVVLFLHTLARPFPWFWAAWTLAFFALSLVTSNALGSLVALASGSSGEVHLYAFVAVAAMAGISGLFSPGPHFGLAGLASHLTPFRMLSDVTLAVWGGPPPQMMVLAVASSCVIFLAALFTSERLFRPI